MWIEAVRRVLETAQSKEFVEVPVECILEALKITMTSNNGEFLKRRFTQINGATIVTCLPPPIAIPSNLKHCLQNMSLHSLSMNQPGSQHPQKLLLIILSQTEFSMSQTVV